MMPYTQISTGDNRFPSTLCFGTQGGDPGGGSAGGKGKTTKKSAKKAPAKKKK
jgi:hypothetical protein